jgi:hypothetical protein
MLGNVNEDLIPKEAAKEQGVNGVKTNDDRRDCQEDKWNRHN